MKSPCCGARAYVDNSRPTEAGNTYRRRECSACGKRITTIEYVVTDCGDTEEDDHG